jgi:hypothetical protein
MIGPAAFTLQTISDFANDHKIPLIFRESEFLDGFSWIGPGHPGACIGFELYCFESDREIVENWLYHTKPIILGSTVIPVQNGIEYSERKLIEFRDSATHAAGK